MIQGACKRIHLTLCYNRIPHAYSLSFGSTRFLASKTSTPAAKAKKIVEGLSSPPRSGKGPFLPERSPNFDASSPESPASRTPVPFVWRLVAVGTVFVAFIAIFKPFEPSEEQAAEKSTKPFLQPNQFVKCAVNSVEASTPSEPLKDKTSSSPFTKSSNGPPTKAEHIIIQMGIPLHLLPASNDHLGNAIYHLYIKDDDMQVERPYTPINGIGIDGKFALWVKRYQGGEVSNWLSRLSRGRNVEIRGIVRQWDWREKDVDEIVMIAGGTGVTAFTQLLHQALFPSQPVLSAVNSRAHFTLLHGHQSPSALPPAMIADDFAMYRENNKDRFTEKCFVERPDGEMDDVPRGTEVGRIEKEAIERALLERGVLLEEGGTSDVPSSFMGSVNPWKQTLPPRPKRRYLNPNKSVMVLVCGPEGMVTSIAGRRPRKSEMAVDQDAPVGGVLGELGLKSSQVRRL